MTKKFIIIALQFCLLLSIIFPAHAHKVNQSYLYLRVYESALSGRFEISLKDLNNALGTNFGDDIAMDEIKPYMDQIQEYFVMNTEFSSVFGQHKLQFEEASLRQLGGALGTYLLVNFTFPDVTEVPEILETKYNVLFDQDRNHVGMLIIEYSWKAGILQNETLPSVTYSKGNIAGTVNLHNGSLFRGFLMMVEQGIWHIWIGIDHILFLFALILPSVITRSKNELNRPERAFSVAVPQLVLNPAEAYWMPVERFKPAFIYIIKIVTFFTIAHTITLGLAAFDIIMLPSRLVESIIAISIALAAYHNIQPVLRGKEWTIAFIFGLFHGFGFASVLAELGSGDYLGLTLFGFNLGVEIGQVAVIIVIFPVLYALRKSRSYNYLLVFGSFLLILISMYWFIERAFEYDLPLGRYLISAYNSLIG